MASRSLRILVPALGLLCLGCPETVKLLPLTVEEFVRGDALAAINLCRLNTSVPILKNRRDYLQSVEKYRFTNGTKIVTPRQANLVIETCENRLNAAQKNILPEPLQVRLEIYLKALRATDLTMTKADKYYRSLSYMDDKMQQGKAMHEQLVRDWNALATADAELRTVHDSAQQFALEAAPDTPLTALLLHGLALRRLVQGEDQKQLRAALVAYRNSIVLYQKSPHKNQDLLETSRYIARSAKIIGRRIDPGSNRDDLMEHRLELDTLLSMMFQMYYRQSQARSPGLDRSQSSNRKPVQASK